jgi:hypothetical protein
MEWEVKNSSLPNRIVHATMSFVFSVLNRNNNKLRRSIAQRFEWYACGASKFLRFIELGGTPRCHVPFNSLVQNLFWGKELHHKIVRKKVSFVSIDVVGAYLEHGTNANLSFIQYDGTPDINFHFSLTVQLSESTDIVGIAVKCLQFFAPHFNCTFENIRNEITQLLTQNYSWAPSIYSYHREHWDKLGSFVSQWSRPNPFCCK